MVASNNEQSQSSFKTIQLPECWRGFAWSKVGQRWGIVRGKKRMPATRFDQTMQSVMGKTFLKGDDGGKHTSLIFA